MLYACMPLEPRGRGRHDGGMDTRRPDFLLMVFVDGLGVGDVCPGYNPIAGDVCPRLAASLRRARAIDAGLGVPGLPQSATGQTALLTGVNAARLLGRHVEGFPGPQLRAVIRERNIFLSLRRAGLTGTFANAYFVDDVSQVQRHRYQSVTTVAALSAFGAVRDRRALEADDAVFHDLTRAGLRRRGYRGPLVEPAQAAEHLLAIARRHDFTLFEYFRTDRAGHRADMQAARVVLDELERFFACLLDRIRETGGGLVLTSDHGNIEDARSHAHTRNPVPLIVAGGGDRRAWDAVTSIADVPAAVHAVLSG